MNTESSNNEGKEDFLSSILKKFIEINILAILAWIVSSIVAALLAVLILIYTGISNYIIDNTGFITKFNLESQLTKTFADNPNLSKRLLGSNVSIIGAGKIDVGGTISQAVGQIKLGKPDIVEHTPYRYRVRFAKRQSSKPIILVMCPDRYNGATAHLFDADEDGFDVGARGEKGSFVDAEIWFVAVSLDT